MPLKHLYFRNISLIVCMGVLPVCLYYMHAVFSKAREDIRSPGSEVNWWLWAGMECYESHPGPLEQKPVLLATRQSLQPLYMPLVPHGGRRLEALHEFQAHQGCISLDCVWTKDKLILLLSPCRCVATCPGLFSAKAWTEGFVDARQAVCQLAPSPAL